MVSSVPSQSWEMHAQLGGNTRVAQEKIIWELFTQEASKKCALQQHAMAWVLLRDCAFILDKKIHFFCRIHHLIGEKL